MNKPKRRRRTDAGINIRPSVALVLQSWQRLRRDYIHKRPPGRVGSALCCLQSLLHALLRFPSGFGAGDLYKTSGLLTYLPRQVSAPNVRVCSARAARQFLLCHVKIRLTYSPLLWCHAAEGAPVARSELRVCGNQKACTGQSAMVYLACFKATGRHQCSQSLLLLLWSISWSSSPVHFLRRTVYLLLLYCLFLFKSQFLRNPYGFFFYKFILWCICYID